MRCVLASAIVALPLLAGPAVAQNTPPVADAGEDQAVFLGEVAQLDGTGSYDPDGDVIRVWLWNFESVPPGSGAILGGQFSPRPGFQPDLLGDYVVSLIVNDGQADSLPDTVTIEVVENVPPTATATSDVVQGVAPLTVGFDGTQSFDPEGGELLYEWSFGDGSVGGQGSRVVHTYDFPGTFVATLVVFDDFGLFDDDRIEITVLRRVVTQPAADSGRYSFSGFHNPSDTGYEALVGGSRSFFVFDLTGLTDPRPVASASLLLDTGTVSSGTFGGITYTLYDVSTPIAAVTAGGSGLTAIYDDLGTGVPYSAATEIEPGTSNTDKSIPLLPAGVSAVEAAMGGMLAIGGGPTGLSGNFAFSGTDVSGARLVIEFEDPTLVPVLSPAAVTLLASLLAGMGFATLRIHRRRGVH